MWMRWGHKHSVHKRKLAQGCRVRMWQNKNSNPFTPKTTHLPVRQGHHDVCNHSLLSRERLSLKIMITKKSGPKLALKPESLTIPVSTLSTSHIQNLTVPWGSLVLPSILWLWCCVLPNRAFHSLGSTVESPGKLKKDKDPWSHSEFEGQDCHWPPTNNGSNIS